MGYEIKETIKIALIDPETGDEYVRFVSPNSKERFYGYSSTLIEPPKPNTRFTISKGLDGKNATYFTFYRPKPFNKFQVWLFKICFGIKIEQGDKIRNEFI